MAALLDILISIDGIAAATKESLGKPEGVKGTHVMQARSWSWVISHDGNEQRLASGVANVGRVSPQPLFFTKMVDEATDGLMMSTLRGTVHPKAELHCYREVNGKNVRYLSLNMEKVLIKSVRPGSEMLDASILETVGLHFESFSVEYAPIDETGNRGKPVQGNFNFKTLK